jgi:hypothetical protein
LLFDYASFISAIIHVCCVWWHAHSFGLPSASIWNYLPSPYYTVYSSSRFQTVKNALCSVIVSHLQFLQTTLLEFVGMFSSIFSASVVITHCWIDETLLNYETWCFINLLSIALAGSVYQFVSFHLQLLQTYLLSLLSWEYFNCPNS